MKQTVLFCGLLVLVLTVFTVCAVEKTWTGGAGDAWVSSAANWSPPGAPADGDTLRFANSQALSVVNDLTGRAYGGITTTGSGAVTLANAGQGFSLSGGIAVEGSGALNIDVPIAIDSAVVFTLTNAPLYVYKAISGTGSITLEGGKILYAKDAVTLTGGITVNLGRIVVEKTSFVAPVTLNQYKVGSTGYVSLSINANGTYAIPITISGNDGSGHTLTCPPGIHVTNTAPVTVAPGTYTRWCPNGSMTYAGGIILQEPYVGGTMSVVFNGNNVLRDVPLAIANSVYADNGIFRFAVSGNTYADLRCLTKTIFTDVPDALDPNANVVFGAGYTKTGSLDLNGNSQTINRPVLSTLDGLAASDYSLTSSSGPATLTCRASGDSLFFGTLGGALSLAWEPLSDSYALTLTGRVSQTAGTLRVTAGTLRLAADTAFPALSGLIATGTGILSLATPQVAVVPVTLADSAVLDLPDGLTFACQSARVDGTTLTVGVYTAASTVNGRPFITGSGTLTVLAVPLAETLCTWTGAGADTRFSNPDNWDVAPAFDGSETFLFDAAGSEARVDGQFNVGALRFNRSTGFSITPDNAQSRLKLGLGDITVLNPPGAAAPVTNTLAVALELTLAHECLVTNNQTLAITAAVSGGSPTHPLVKDGDGTLSLTGTNTFESPLVLSNGLVMANTGTALGHPSNTITIARATSASGNTWATRGPLYFTDAVATNDRPIIVAPAVSYIGQIYPNAGTLVLNGAFTFMSNGRIDNPGTLLFRGGFTCLNANPWMQTWANRVMRFEDIPLDLGSRSISIDNEGTFHVCTTNNTWSSVGLYKSVFLCGAENCLPTNSFVTFGVSYASRGYLELNGFNQQVKYLTYTPSSNAPTNMAVRSSAPATLTLQGDTGTRVFIGYFTNRVSLCHRNTGTLALTGPTSASVTDGELRIEAGAVSFRNGATWQGSTNITVTAGTLSVEGGSGTTFGGNDPEVNRTQLNLTSAATVNLAAGVTEYVNTATLDGRRLPVGTYGSAASGAQHQSERFTGTGVLIVMREERTGTLFTLR
ncbi:MAG TPA: hypothetical protein PLW27_02855 [Kiritimatiellia bacterium]|nr:MAG: hypothetical protein BWX70_00780 [Verrucomicrobia bacterium ADurb.Bin070]HQA37819.1 hypothetical protein [Kiritimatiellia bacterium]